jgi:excinuclease ABC subunit A
MLDKIIIKGAKEHNLKNIDLEVPKNKLVVFTGISGSGKSSLVFDTIFAEGQRRYIESLSSYARQFLGQLEKPNVEYIEGLSPAIAIDQKSAGHNPRSTVGTITEIYDYMRLLFAKIGIPFCANCGSEIRATSIDEMIEHIIESITDEKNQKNTVQIFAPIVKGKKGEYSELVNNMYHSGYSKAKIDGNLVDISKKISLARYKIHTIDILVDELVVNSDNLSRLTEALETAASLTKGSVLVIDKLTNKESHFTQSLICSSCETNFPEIEPRLFSFNSPFGACIKCNGLGTQKTIDRNLVIPDYNKTVSEGGILPFSYKNNNFYGTLFRAVMSELGLDPQKRLKDWKKDEVNYLLFGREDRVTHKIKISSSGRKYSFYMNFNGVIPWLEKRYLETDSPLVRDEVEKYMSAEVCPDCNGNRLKKEALLVRVGEKSISNITQYTITNALDFFNNLKLNNRQTLIAEKILKEIKARLVFLIDVGLEYLTLNRTGATLAGGESQRIRLASQIGSALTGVLYVLDEPSIGLHARDQSKLINILKKLRDLGNSVLVVEHDEQTMKAADWIIDIGPGAGKLGGQVIAQGTYDNFIKTESITAKYLTGREKVEVPTKRRISKHGFITVTGGTENNLKNVKAHFPIGLFTCVTGVSGSGKSSLVVDILYKSLARKVNRSLEKPGKHNSVEGYEDIKKVVMIDQSPIGRTPRSNPATYTGVFTHIRELFAQTKDAKIKAYGPGRFSFNVAVGRCQTCSGEGFLQIEMQFLPDVYIPCDICNGKRYNKETLTVKYKNKNIAEVLAMSVSEALDFFQNIPKIAHVLKILEDVGLGYIELGQAATTLSGGEAQRIKLASELSKSQIGKSFYILDEPTTGLHYDDIKKLLDVLNRLVNAGNTVVVIEHNLDVIKVADNIIDLGPEGGDSGGTIIASGTPEEIAKTKVSHTGRFLAEVL